MENNKQQEEKDWQEKTGMNEDSLCAVIEAILFMSDHPLSLNRIKRTIGHQIPLSTLHHAIERLQEDYNVSHHGIQLQEVAEGYQFRTKMAYAPFLRGLLKSNTLMLSSSVLEVLAIVAYNQPVSRMDIERIRGVDSSHIVRRLIEKRLIKIVGKSQDIGRPTVYGTTKEFLEIFNLAGLADLPPRDELEDMAPDSVGNISDIKELISIDHRKEFMADDIEEIAHLEETIKSVSSGTDFTKNLGRFSKKKDDIGTKQTVFDLLDEHVEKEQIKEANTAAASSKAFAKMFSPEIISDFLSKDLQNAPQPQKGIGPSSIEEIFCAHKGSDQTLQKLVEENPT